MFHPFPRMSNQTINFKIHNYHKVVIDLKTLLMPNHFSNLKILSLISKNHLQWTCHTSNEVDHNFGHSQNNNKRWPNQIARTARKNCLLQHQIKMIQIMHLTHKINHKSRTNKLKTNLTL